MIRKVIEKSGADLGESFDGATLGERLLEPTRIYIKPLLKLFEQVEVHALAHITGGGLLENLPRVMPINTAARLKTSSWQPPAIFEWLQSSGNIETNEMYRTFNCGLGMVLVVDAADADKTLAILHTENETAVRIGEIVPATGEPRVEILD